MKKILALVAIVAMSTNVFADEGKDNASTRTGYKATDELKDGGKTLEESYKSVPNPARPFVGTITSPLGNTVQYVAEGVAILGQEGVEGMVKAVVKSGECISESRHHQPGIFAGCVIRLGGDSTIVVINTVGYSAANIVDLGGEVLSDLAYIWSDAAFDLEDGMRRAGLPVLPEVAHVIGFVLDASGRIVELTFGTVSYAVRGVTEGLAITVDNVFDVPVSLLAGNGQRAGQSLTIAVGAGLCTAVDLGLNLTVRPFLGLLNLIDKGNRTLNSCMDRAKRDAKAIRDGTYKAPVRRARNGDIL